MKIGGFLSAVGRGFQGYAQDQDNRMQRTMQQSTLNERKRTADAAANIQQTFRDNYRAAIAGDVDAQTRIVSVLPDAHSMFPRTAKPNRTYDSTRGAIVDVDGGTAAPVEGLPGRPQAAPRTLATKDGIMQWDDDSGGWKATGMQPPERAQDSRSAVIQGTDGGPIIVDTRSGVSRPVVTQGGSPVQMRAPANVTQAVVANRRQLGTIDNALKDIDDNPDAVGFFRGRIDAWDQRVDPKGVGARANVADIGSMVVHDRSGAAVTVAEYPRLAPFIPKASDNAATVKVKLQRMRAIIAEDNAAIEEAYPATRQSAQPPQSQFRLPNQDY